jgi:DNA-binding IclR family transcriptional regulator
MINSVLKAIDILETFGPGDPRLSLADISTRLDIPKSTVHNLLNTLVSRGFIEKTDDGRYAVGKAVVPLTQAVRVNVELRDRAAPLLRELADVCHTSVYLGVLDRGRVLYIYAIETPHRLRARTAVGDRAHLHCTSVGKALLSALTEKEIERIVSQQGLPRFTDATITELDILLEEIAQTRARGYAVDLAEHEPGNYCIGAPILDGQGSLAGSCSISSLDPAIVNEQRKELAAHLVYTAQEISRRLGHVPARPSAVAAVPSTVANRRSFR